jgi:ABC-type bacteriocin/lantibiotic exporter with double-glycine peptidase domain
MPKNLYAYIWQTSRREQIVLCILTVAVSFLTAAPLELQRRIVDNALPERRLSLLFLLGTAYLAVLVVQAVSNTASTSIAGG